MNQVPMQLMVLSLRLRTVAGGEEAGVLSDEGTSEQGDSLRILSMKS